MRPLFVVCCSCGWCVGVGVWPCVVFALCVCGRVWPCGMFAFCGCGRVWPCVAMCFFVFVFYVYIARLCFACVAVCGHACAFFFFFVMWILRAWACVALYGPLLILRCECVGVCGLVWPCAVLSLCVCCARLYLAVCMRYADCFYVFCHPIAENYN